MKHISAPHCSVLPNKIYYSLKLEILYYLVKECFLRICHFRWVKEIFLFDNFPCFVNFKAINHPESA